jgi:hypothetical protein
VPIDELVNGFPARTPVSSADMVDQATTALILQMHDRGASLNAIAVALDARGSQTRRGRRWRPKSVARVIAATRFPELRQQSTSTDSDETTPTELPRTASGN